MSVAFHRKLKAEDSKDRKEGQKRSFEDQQQRSPSAEGGKTKTKKKGYSKTNIFLLGQWTELPLFNDDSPALLLSPFHFGDRPSLPLRARAAVAPHSCVPDCGDSMQPKRISAAGQPVASLIERAVSSVSVGKQSAGERHLSASDGARFIQHWLLTFHWGGGGWVGRGECCTVHYRFRSMNFKNVAFHAPHSSLEVGA